jgi:hypothetical protein
MESLIEMCEASKGKMVIIISLVCITIIVLDLNLLEYAFVHGAKCLHHLDSILQGLNHYAFIKVTLSSNL